MREVLILGGARTAFGRFGGGLKDISAVDLGTIALKAALTRSGLDADRVDNVVVGNVIQTGEDFAYLSRHIALAAGIPQSSPAMGVNRLCGSGMQAVLSAAQSILLGESDVAAAGGTESMSQAPFALRNRFGYGMGTPTVSDTLWETLADTYCGTLMAITAENLAEKFAITREEQDQFSMLSNQRAGAAMSAGRFAAEIAPVPVAGRKSETNYIDTDEHPRPDVTLAGLSKLPARFKAGGTVTAGNASGINDGAAMLVLAAEGAVQGAKPLGRIVSSGVAGVDPHLMGIGPVPACRLALKRANLRLDQIDLVEINEAFAAQYLAVERELGLDRERTNVNGGGIALGHPVGASGARIILSLLLELQRRGGRYGMASLCIGGGQGIAVVVEAFPA